jgi:hypothetical protein
MKNKEMKIRQRKDECHYETSIEESIRGGHMPVAIGYGITQAEADTKCLNKFKELKS